MLDKPEIFVRSRSFGRTRREVTDDDRSVVVESESCLTSAGPSGRSAPKLRNILQEHEAQLSHQPGYFPSKNKTPEREPGSYVPKTYKPNPLKNTPSPHKKETSPPKNVRFKKDGDARYGQAGQAVRDWAPDGPVKILKRDTNKKEVNSSTPANNRLRKTKVNAASNVKKSSNPLLDDDEDLITDSLQLKVEFERPRTSQVGDKEKLHNAAKSTSENTSISDTKSKVPNKKKQGRQKEKVKVKTDIETNNEPGSLFTRQWPKIPHIFEAENDDFLILCEANVLVSEKLDGSNMAVSNRNYITSRRNILLNNPTEEELKKYKFSGQRMAGVFDVVTQINLIHDRFCKLFPFLEIETLLYGELIQAGTATSKEDKYNYRSKGFLAGDFVTFGCGISFDDQLDDGQMTVAKKHLKSKGYNVMVVEDGETCNKYIVLLMNDKLSQLLKSNGINKLIQHKMVALESCLKDNFKKLETNEIEGVVIVSESAIYKWKGVEENYPDLYVDQITKLHNFVRCKKPGKEKLVDYLQRVATAAKQLREKSKGERVKKGEKVNPWTETLEVAFKSAASKYPHPAELLKNEAMTNEQKQKIKEIYINDIQREMIQDVEECIGKEEKNPESLVRSFIQMKLK